MTDDEIKIAVCAYIQNQFESDNADCLHECDEFLGEDYDTPQSTLYRAYAFYRLARLTVTFDE